MLRVIHGILNEIKAWSLRVRSPRVTGVCVSPCNPHILPIVLLWVGYHAPEIVFDRDISRSCEILGAKEIVIGSRESSLYDGDGNDRKLIMEQLEAIQPEIVFIMWPQDSHPEHRRVARTSYDAILNSFWDQKLNSIREIYAYEADPNQAMQYFIPDFYIKIDSVKDILKDCIENCIAGKGPVLWQRKADKGYFRGWCSDFGHVLTEAFKVIKFPGKTGLDGSDLLLRRLLADHFKWAGSSAWPYGNIYFQH